MAVSLNSVVGFSSTVTNYFISADCKHFIKKGSVPSVLKASYLTSSLVEVGIRPLRTTRWRLPVGDGDRLTTDTTDKTFPSSNSSENETAVRPPESGSKPQVAGASNGSVKRSSLTAREKLRAARVLSRYTEPKTASKPKMGSRLLEALKESDKGKKRPGLPEAPTNIFDDSKRGMPKPGWTFDFPGGVDVLVIALSFLFISTVMFATTFIVWKVGAIHFNEF